MATVKEKETTDEVLKEMREIKEKLAASMGFDLDRILADARQRQSEDGRKVLSHHRAEAPDGDSDHDART